MYFLVNFEMAVGMLVSLLENVHVMVYALLLMG